MASLPNSNDHIREEVLNVHLADFLQNYGLSAQAERRSRKGAPDVRVQLPSGLVLVECKWEGGENDLSEQAQARLTAFPDALGVYGLLYPDRLRSSQAPRAELAAATDLEWWLHGSCGVTLTSRQTHTGSIADLADELRALPMHLEGVDKVDAAAASVGYALEQAAGQIARHARIHRLVADIIADTDKEKDRAAAVRIGCLVLFNALAFQDRLASAQEDVATVAEALRQGPSGLLSAWRHICDNIDYVPVFSIAIEILDVLMDGPDDLASTAVEHLARAVKDTRGLGGHDLAGRLFHTLLSGAKFTGAYYTSVPAATMLARLVFNGWPAGVDWSDYEYPAVLNIADLACGTGTLLMAVAAEAERLHMQAGGKDAAKLHKVMVEEAIHGYDVQLSAIHFAATSLAMLNPSIQFDRMNLYVMPLGVEGGKVSLGSLDFLGESTASVQFALSPESLGVGELETQRVSGRGPRGAQEGQSAKVPELDLAIMNPPFTRSGNLLFGMLKPDERHKIQKELAVRLQARDASATAGLGSAFVAAAAPKLRPGEGRLALVLPLTICTGASWEQTRALIERDFTLNMVITSHDPLRWNFSDSTDLSEALLIATRRAESSNNAEQRTTFVNLWRNPDNLVDAHRTAQAIAATMPADIEGNGAALLSVSGEHIGEAVSIRESAQRGGKWAGVQFARADVTRSAVRLLDEGKVWTPGIFLGGGPLCRLDALGSLGPDRRDILDGFERTAAITAYPMLEGNDTEQRKRLVAEPDKHLAPLTQARPGRKLKRVEQLWPKAGRLFIAERLRLTTVRVIAIRMEVNALSNVWYSVRLADERYEKTLAVWLNSSLGLLSVLAQRTSTEGGWVSMKKSDWEKSPVLDVRQLAPEQLQALSDLFDGLQQAEFERLPSMAHCPARTALDRGVAEILGLPPLDKLRELLASEPVISNQRL